MEPHHELAFAKLTRTLRVVGRRADGYHLLDSEMLSLDLADELEFVRSSVSSLELTDAVAWTGAGGEVPALPCGPENLVLRALALAGVCAAVRLTKRIPAGAGLGGGSADAAAALRFAGFADPFLAARLGADVPFCLRNGRARVRGIGELLEPLASEPATFLLVTPAHPVSTPAVYAAFDEIGPPERDGARNDLEAAALAVEPRLAWARDLLAEVTGEEPTLAGSGATWFVECDAARGTTWSEELRAGVLTARSRAVVTLAHAVGASAPLE